MNAEEWRRFTPLLRKALPEILAGAGLDPYVPSKPGGPLPRLSGLFAPMDFSVVTSDRGEVWYPENARRTWGVFPQTRGAVFLNFHDGVWRYCGDTTFVQRQIAKLLDFNAIGVEETMVKCPFGNSPGHAAVEWFPTPDAARLQLYAWRDRYAHPGCMHPKQASKYVLPRGDEQFNPRPFRELMKDL